MALRQFGATPAAPRDTIVLPAADGSEPAEPVRIFVETEARQERAERVFVYAIEQCRRPDREYRIHRMRREDAGLSQGGRGGEARLRLAVADYAGGHGRALVNTVEQLYTQDPGELFDSAMGAAGYLARSPTDTAVMLIDCKRMAAVWNRARLAQQSAMALLQEAALSGELWGEMNARWHARDTEYEPGRSGLLHFARPDLRPWRPYPEYWAYYPHPLRDVWQRLEREADEAGYELFTAQSPSRAYRELGTLTAARSVRSDLDTILGRLPRSVATGERVAVCGLDRALRSQEADCEPAALPWIEAADHVVVPREYLAALPAADVAWALDQLLSGARRSALIRVVCCDRRAARASAGSQPASWWRAVVERVRRRRPSLAWRLELCSRGGRVRQAVDCDPQRPGAERGLPPRVWVLFGERRGDNAQLQRLVETMGWDYVGKQLFFDRSVLRRGWLCGRWPFRLKAGSDHLDPPWPDVVIACGCYGAIAARWIQRRAGGGVRLIHLGRPWQSLARFDLVITTPQYRLPIAGNVHVNTLPLNRPTAEQLEQAWHAYKADGAPGAVMARPRWTALIGGDARPYRLDRRAAVDLGRRLNRLVDAEDASLFVACGGRCREAAYTSLLACLDVDYVCHHPAFEGGPNPYMAYLGGADGLVVTGDSASMLADACATGKTIYLYAPPVRRDSRQIVVSLLRWGLLGRDPSSRRWRLGSRLFAWLVATGWLTSVRTMSVLHAELLVRGLVQPLAGENASAGREVVGLTDEYGATTAAVRAALTCR